MARQRVHNQRAGRGGSGSVWISYSDMMAALVLMFVLFLVYNLHNYNSMMEEKTRELEQKTLQVEAQQAKLDEQEGIIIIKQGELDAKTVELDQLKLDLDAKETELEKQTVILIGQQQELDEARSTLASRETELNQLKLRLDAQQELFDAQAEKIDSMVGVRSQIVRDLSIALNEAHLNAQVDELTGDIVLNSTVFFETNSYAIKEEGKQLLSRFLPVYLSVLTRDEYSEYLGEIIVEGHTDSDGTYISNLKLSQNRALSVVEYCLQTVSASERALLQKILTAKGRSSSVLVYNADGTENKGASRRVEFKFSLRDSEMIQEMNRILTMDSAGGDGT